MECSKDWRVEQSMSVLILEMRERWSLFLSVKRAARRVRSEARDRQGPETRHRPAAAAPSHADGEGRLLQPAHRSSPLSAKYDGEGQGLLQFMSSWVLLGQI